MGNGCSNCSTKDDDLYQVEVDRNNMLELLPKDSEAAKIFIQNQQIEIKTQTLEDLPNRFRSG